VARARLPYTRSELFRRGPQPTCTGRDLDEVAFPLGGIGTGTISLGGWGQLRDFEIMNRPAKGFRAPMTFFALRVQEGKKPPVARVLQGPAGGSYTGDGHSASHGTPDGLPHFRRVSFQGEYPVARLRFRDPAMPVSVALEAFNPFIPLNDKDSGIPAAVFLYRLRNRTKKKMTATVFGCLSNIVGHPDKEGRVNRARRARGLAGLYLTTNKHPEDSPKFGSMALATTGKAQVWRRAPQARFLQVPKLWDAISGKLKFPPLDADGSAGMVAAEVTIQPGEEVTVPFFLAWYFPVFEHWKEDGCGRRAAWRNYYATQWADAWDVAKYVAGNFGRLYGETRRFHDTLFSSTLPAHVLDAVSSQISTLRTSTCLRLEDGTFYGFEGCSDASGSCEGSCTHVWNYAQALPYLFPSLQRSMSEAHFENSMSRDGFIQFRMPLPLGTKAKAGFVPAADGQMGLVMQVYREWLIGNDEAWLRRVWPLAKRALEFAWKYWDADRDGVMEGVQHNTYDQEFWGPNTMTGSLYLGALRAGEELARAVGDEDSAATYRKLFRKGSAWTDGNLFNGEYYEQRVNPRAAAIWPKRYRDIIDRGKDDRFKSWPRWQFGKGCLSDQLIGQWIAMMLGLGHLYDRRKVRKTLRSIFRYNWRANLSGHVCTLRIYALNDEAGLLIGTWPRGGRPGNPFWFTDEVWSGIEYQVASHLIYEGLVEEGLAVVKGARDRYRGGRRNPWDEIECGHHYARSMSSYALLTALSGFHYSAPDAAIGFAPSVFEKDFRTFFSVASGWGQYSQKVRGRQAALAIRVDHGELTVGRIVTPLIRKGSRITVTAAGRRRAARAEAGAAVLDEAVTIRQGQTLRITTT